MIAFSTDANVASRGVYLLSFLPESDVERVVAYAASTGKRSFAALLPDNGYGTVVEAAFKQAVAKRGGRVTALERYPADKANMMAPARRIARSAGRIDAIFIADSGDVVPTLVDTLVEGGVNTKKIQLLGTRDCGRPAHRQQCQHSGRRLCGARYCRLSELSVAIGRNTARSRCGRRRLHMMRSH